MTYLGSDALKVDRSMEDQVDEAESVGWEEKKCSDREIPRRRKDEEGRGRKKNPP
jgi:hypothetical protein